MIFKDLFTNTVDSGIIEEENDTSSKLKKELVLEMAGISNAAKAAKAAAKAASVEGGADDETEVEEKEPKDKEFKASAGKMTQTIKLFDAIFNNMENKRDVGQFHSPLLTSDPGVGKTQRLNLLSKLLGIEMITIEAPHIVEEHIINIPFIVFNPETNSESAGHTVVKVSGNPGDKESKNSSLYHVEIADSNLYTQLKHARKISDEALLKEIYASGDDVIKLFEYYGGSEQKIPTDFKQLRETYTVILFFDEYYRQTSARIRTILRGVLNNKIGIHTIPKNAYIIYASNLEDEGIEDDFNLNEQFAQRKLANPDKEEWFSWLVFKFQKDQKVKLNEKLVNKFYTILDDEDISKNDFESDVRTSPRRWEQLLLYINSSLPCKDDKDARNLLSNVKINFRNYETGAHSKLFEKVLDATGKLIKETSPNVNIDSIAIRGKGNKIIGWRVNENTDWAETLKHQIEVREKLGNMRKYVPVVAGMPGIAKTAKAAALAKQMDLGYIYVDVSSINPEDAVGLPLPKFDKSEGGERKEHTAIETEFSLPTLYQQIMEKVHEEDRERKKKLQKDDPSGWQEKWAEYEKRPLKYLLFLDELNRAASMKVFNVMRRVLLEKNFGHSSEHGKLLALPEEMLIFSALNPFDKSVIPITKHMRDVLDIIDAAPTWKNTMDYFHSQKQTLKNVDPETADFVQSIVEQFDSQFSTKESTVEASQRPFYLVISGEKLWFSPRETIMMMQGMARALQREINRFYDRVDASEASELDDAARDKIEKDMKLKIYDAMEEVLSFVIHKQTKSDAPEFMIELKNWVLHNPEINLTKRLFSKTAASVQEISFSEILGDHLDGKAGARAHYDSFFINYILNANVADFVDDINELVLSRFITDDGMGIKKYLFEDNYPILKLAYKGKKFTKKMHSDGLIPDGIIEDSTKKVCLVENFYRELYFSCKIDNVENSLINALLEASFKPIKAYTAKFKKDASDEILEILSETSEKMSNIIDDLDSANLLTDLTD